MAETAVSTFVAKVETTPFFSRGPELERLLARLNADRGGTCVVHGPRGAGKSRILAELARFAKASRVLTLEARALDRGGSSFAPFAEIARSAVAWAESSGHGDLVDPVLPGLETALGSLAEAQTEAPSLERKLAFFDAVRRLLSGVAERTRLLVIVQDLDRADADTLELAADLADGFAGDPLERTHPGLLVLSLSDPKVAESPAADFLLDQRERRPADMILVGRLDLDGLKKYLTSPRVLEKLMAASDGLPHEIDEIIDALPANVEELFLRRFESFDPLSREILSALALASGPASARALAEVLNQPQREVARALSVLKEARILERSIDNGEIHFAFARAKNLEITAQTISPELASRVHGGWAEVLSREPARPGRSSIIAHHLLRSNDPSRGVGLAIKAAEAHAVTGAHDAAAKLFAAALPHARETERAFLFEQLARLAAVRGQRREALRWVEDWKSARKNDLGPVSLFEAELANAAGDHQRALAVVEEARAWIGEDSADRIELEITCAEAYYHQGKLDEARERGRAGLLLAERLGDTARQRVELVNLLGKIALAADDVEAALVSFAETLRLSVSSALARQEARARVNIGLAYMRSADELRAEENLEAGVAKAKESGDLSHLAFGHLNLGVLAHQRSRLGAALEHYRAAQAIFRRLGNKTQLARVLYNLANLSFAVGAVDRAETFNAEALRIAEAGKIERLLAIVLALEGSIAAEKSDYVTAAKRLREAMIHQRRLGTERPVETLVDLADVEYRAGEPEVAEQILAELEPSRARIKSPRIAAKVRLLKGRLLTARRDASAAPLLEQALRELSVDDRLLRAELHVALGKAALSARELAVARTELQQARAIRASVRDELPEDLRVCFKNTRVEVELEDAFESLELECSPRPASPEPAFVPVQAAKKEAPRRVRSLEWDERYTALVGHAPKLLKVFHILDRVRDSDSTVLVQGESGTGKELVAEALHRSSPRRDGPFVKLNCAALVETLLLSELFGHERGSFTGAHQRKAGRFELAAGGTIFLDEIGDISPKTQVALLRVLQEREFERVGGGRPIKLEARVVCATNKNLLELVRQGIFREDLYYRLKGITVEMPALRDRLADIPVLVSHFLVRHAKETGMAPKRISAEVEKMLMRYRWPGNVRELENVIRSVALFADGSEIARQDFDEYEELFENATPFEAEPELPRLSVPSPDPTEPLVRAQEPRSLDGVGPEEELLSKVFNGQVSLADLKRKIQAEAIARALVESQGNITRAAEKLGMKRPRLSQIINANEALKKLCQEAAR